jgi:hypothetical protein
MLSKGTYLEVHLQVVSSGHQVVVVDNLDEGLLERQYCTGQKVHTTPSLRSPVLPMSTLCSNLAFLV